LTDARQDIIQQTLLHICNLLYLMNAIISSMCANIHVLLLEILAMGVTCTNYSLNESIET